MNSKQEAKRNMFLASRAKLQQFFSVWTANTEMTSAVADFDALISDLDDQREIQEKDNTGITVDKKNMKLELAVEASRIGAAVASYAAKTSNDELYELVNYSEADLFFGLDTFIVDQSKIIHDNANANIAALAPFGITAPTLANLQTLIDDYTEAIPAPRTAGTEKSDSTESIDLLISDIDDILERRVDNLVSTYKTSNTNFVNQYTSARKIVNPPTTTRALAINVKDSITLQPVANVSITINPGTILKKTTQKGNAILATLAAGSYTAAIAKAGYTTQNINFNIVSGETTSLSITFVALP